MKRVKFKKFAGVRIKGSSDSELIKTKSIYHIDRAVWLTCMVESGGKFGCVISYDGTGITASLGQAIAVYPRNLGDEVKKNDQGPLWKVLKRIKNLPPMSDMTLFENKLANVGWYISPDSKCRWIRNGKLVSGQAIRKEFTGSEDGVMPTKGKDRARAQFWAETFHDLFANPDTFKLQLDLEKEHFVKRAERAKLRFCREEEYAGSTVQKVIYNPFHISSITSEQLGPEMDLAMSIYWSHSVNAPGYALKRFCRHVVDKGFADEWMNEAEGRKLAKKIIQKFGETPFARWSDDIKNGRYQRTRAHAMKLWPKELFVGPDAIMPKDL